MIKRQKIYIYGGSPSPGEPDTSVENADKLNKALKLAGLHRSTKVTIVPYIPGVPAPSESLHPTFPTLWIVD